MKLIKKSWVNFNRFMDNQSVWFCVAFIICWCMVLVISTAAILAVTIFYLGIESLIAFPFIFVVITYIIAQFKQKGLGNESN